MAVIKFGSGLEKRDGVYGFATAGVDNLRTGKPVKLDANGNYVPVSSASDKIAGFSYWGLYQTPTQNGLSKEDKHEVIDSSVVVRTTNYMFDSFRAGEQFNLIKEGYELVIVCANVNAGDDVYYDLTTGLYTNVSTNNLKVGNSKFEANAENGDALFVYLTR